jgi:hypothetical protein
MFKIFVVVVFFSVDVCLTEIISYTFFFTNYYIELFMNVFFLSFINNSIYIKEKEKYQIYLTECC